MKTISTVQLSANAIHTVSAHKIVAITPVEVVNYTKDGNGYSVAIWDSVPQQALVIYEDGYEMWEIRLPTSTGVQFTTDFKHVGSITVCGQLIHCYARRMNPKPLKVKPPKALTKVVWEEGADDETTG
jgi:hypothetical protein